MESKFLLAWEAYKKATPNRTVKSITIHNDSKRKFFSFADAGNCITLYPDGTFKTELIPASIKLL